MTDPRDLFKKSRDEIEALSELCPVTNEEIRNKYSKPIGLVDQYIEELLEASKLPDDVLATYFSEKIAQILSRCCTTSLSSIAAASLFSAHTVVAVKAIKSEELLLTLLALAAKKNGQGSE